MIAGAASVTGSAALSSSDAALGVTATVIRPIVISAPAITARGSTITISNIADAVVWADEEIVSRPGRDTTTITAPRSGAMTITIEY